MSTPVGVPSYVVVGSCFQNLWSLTVMGLMLLLTKLVAERLRVVVEVQELSFWKYFVVVDSTQERTRKKRRRH